MIGYCLWRFRVSPSRHLACAAALLLAGCSAARPPDPDDAASVSAADVLRRCGAAHRDLKTLQARGWLRDFRTAAAQVFPIEWYYSRPDRCRLQIGMDVAVVSGEQWWAFHSKTGEFRKHRQFTRTPIETAAYLLSDGIPFLLPTLLARGETAFSPGRLGRSEQWRLEGVAWHAEAPCYVLARRSQVQGQGHGDVLRIWVDQDRFLLRGWEITMPGRGGGQRPILECSYSEVVPDGKLPSDWLQLKSPAPIKLPARAG